MVQVAVIQSISYTGTTWLNTVLGSADGTFALGPPDRAWQMRDSGFEGACLVHRDGCEFWSRFAESYRPERGFLPQLAECAGAHTIVINNPTPDFEAAELRRADVSIKTIRLIRDGRGILASYVRKYPDLSVLEGLTGWLCEPYHAFPFDPADQESLSLRYEDVEADKRGALARIGEFLGVEYPESAMRFWTRAHHFTAGNQGLVALVQMGQSLPVPEFEGKGFYEERFAQIQADPAASFTDERWKQELTRRDRFLFDLLCGADSERFGYDRDRFTLAEVVQFVDELEQARRADHLPQRVARLAETVLEPVRSALGKATANAPPATVAATPRLGLRRQIGLGRLRRDGLYVAPQYLKKLIAMAGITVASLLLIGLVIGLLL
jgi:hypothetical protein